MKMEISFPGGVAVNASYGGFLIKTDQPQEDGGTNQAPSPFSLFLASIGTCTGFYVASFCQKHNIPTDNIKLIADFQRNPSTHMVETITIDIQVPKDFPDQYKNAVIKAADVCTVKRHLEHPPMISLLVTKH